MPHSNCMFILAKYKHSTVTTAQWKAAKNLQRIGHVYETGLRAHPGVLVVACLGGGKVIAARLVVAT